MGAAKTASVARIAERGYWREAEARVVVEAWRRSGLGLKEFARQYGVQPQRVGRWAERLESGGEVQFHPVRVVAPEQRVESVPGAPLEILVGGGWSVRVFPGFAAEDLERVLGVLEGAC